MSDNTSGVNPELINSVLLGLSLIESTIRKDADMTRLLLTEVDLPSAVAALVAAGSAILEVNRIEYSPEYTTAESIRHIRMM